MSACRNHQQTNVSFIFLFRFRSIIFCDHEPFFGSMTFLSLTKVFSPSYSPRKSSRSNLGQKLPAFTPSSPPSSPSSSSSSPPSKKQRPSHPKKAPPLKKAPVNGKKATTSTKKKAKALRRPVLSSVHNGTNTPMAPRPRTVSFGGTFPTANVRPIINPYRRTPRTVPTVIPIVNDIRVLPSPTTAFIDDDTPPPTTTASTTNSTTNSPVDSTSDSLVFFLDLSGRPSLPPSKADDSDDEANEGDRPNDEPRSRSKRKHPMLPVATKASRSKQRKDRRRKKTLKSKREVARLRAHQQRRAVIHGPASLIQLTLSGSVLDVNEEFFDRLSLAKKDDSVFRYGWHSLDPWPAMACPEGQVENKNHRICSEIKDHGFDMLCGSEHGLNMDLLSAPLWHRPGNEQGHLRLQHHQGKLNRHCLTTRRSMDGCNQTCCPPHHLSRKRLYQSWPFAFQLIQGKHGQTTAFISAYQPVHNTRDDNSMYRQHLNYLHQEEVNRAWECPREAFISNLEQLICGFQTKSYEVVVGLDANEDVTKGPVAAMFARRNMKNAILEHYCNVTPPATYNRGRLSIDAIFHTEGLVPCRVDTMPLGLAVIIFFGWISLPSQSTGTMLHDCTMPMQEGLVQIIHPM
jgi:hypothetical protein